MGQFLGIIVKRVNLGWCLDGQVKESMECLWRGRVTVGQTCSSVPLHMYNPDIVECEVSNQLLTPLSCVCRHVRELIVFYVVPIPSKKAFNKHLIYKYVNIHRKC